MIAAKIFIFIRQLTDSKNRNTKFLAANNKFGGNCPKRPLGYVLAVK